MFMDTAFRLIFWCLILTNSNDGRVTASRGTTEPLGAITVTAVRMKMVFLFRHAADPEH
jgi:hypothetical protein